MRRRVPGAALILAAIFLGSVAARIYAASLRTTPLYYPDEYIYTALARSIASTGLPSLRGSVLHFPSLLVPYLIAPAWLIGDVSAAYHLVLDLGVVWFSAAVFPAYALARKVGITPRGSLLVALLSILVPDAALATSGLTEPYAYPLFLATMVVAIEAIVAPTRARQFAAIALMATLCVARVQFAFVFVVFAVAAVGQARGSARRALRAQPGVAAVMLLGIVSAALLGFSRLVGFYSFPTNPDVLLSTWRWFGLDLFVLAVAAGWVVVPGALVGLSSLMRSADDRARVFAILVVGVIVGVVAQAAYVDAFQHRVHERYTFYAAPLLAVACMWAVENKFSPRAYAFAAYGLVVAAILVPATQSLRSAGSGQSPILLGLEPAGGGGSTIRVVWPVCLALGALIIGLLRSRPFVSVVLATLISASICVVATRALLRFVPFSETAAASYDINLFRVGVPANAALLTWAGTDRNVLMKTLFWTPAIERVLVLGGGSAADGFPATSVSFRPVGIVDGTGRAVVGPFAFAPDTTVVDAGAHFSTAVSWLQRSPPVVVLGLDRGDRYLGTVAELLIASRPSPSAVRLELQNTDSPRTLTLACSSHQFSIRLGRAAKWVRIKAAASGATRCRISLTTGAAVQRNHRLTSGVRVVRLIVDDAS